MQAVSLHVTGTPGSMQHGQRSEVQQVVVHVPQCLTELSFPRGPGRRCLITGAHADTRAGQRRSSPGAGTPFAGPNGVGKPMSTHEYNYIYMFYPIFSLVVLKRSRAILAIACGSFSSASFPVVVRTLCVGAVIFAVVLVTSSCKPPSHFFSFWGCSFESIVLKTSESRVAARRCPTANRLTPVRCVNTDSANGDSRSCAGKTELTCTIVMDRTGMDALALQSRVYQEPPLCRSRFCTIRIQVPSSFPKPHLASATQ